MSYLLNPINGIIAPYVVPKAIDAATLATCMQELQNEMFIISPTYDPTNLTAGQRKYKSRKSFSFNPLGQQTSSHILFLLTSIVQEHLSSIWTNTFPDKIAGIEPQGLRYVTGGLFGPHADNAVWVPDTTKPLGGSFVINNPHRQISCVLCLNDDYEGGELYFQQLNQPTSTSVKLGAGDLVIFGSDDRYRHGVSEVTSGERFVLQLHFGPL